MSTTTTTNTNTNINITNTNITGKCDLKCAYNFKYPSSNSTATNNGIMISLSYDSSSSPPVVYNQQKYNVTSILIVYPSVHMFNGYTVAGEIIVEHTPVMGGNQLNVCVPLISSSDTSTASTVVTNIINTVSTNAPSDGETTSLNMSDFTLQSIIPRSPFYTYTESNLNWIVFGDLYAIPLSSSTLSTLQEIISPYAQQTTSSELFYNPTGPSSGVQIGDGLYISCQPTGSSSEETEVEYDKPSYAVNFDNPIIQMILLIIVGCLFFFGFFYGIGMVYKKISGTPTTTNYT